MVGMKDSGQRGRFLVDMKSVSMGWALDTVETTGNLERFLMVAKPGGV